MQCRTFVYNTHASFARRGICTEKHCEASLKHPEKERDIYTQGQAQINLEYSKHATTAALESFRSARASDFCDLCGPQSSCQGWNVLLGFFYIRRVDIFLCGICQEE